MTNEQLIELGKAIVTAMENELTIEFSGMTNLYVYDNHYDEDPIVKRRIALDPHQKIVEAITIAADIKQRAK
jgi:hypothetical protein